MLKVVTKGMFIDRQKVLNRLDAKRASVLGRTGAFTRKSMQRSMRYHTKSGKPSKPGKPPRARRAYPLLRQRIAFGVDGDEVITGPLVRRSTTSVKVPRLLNEGGVAKVVLPGGDKVRAKYLPRPFATDESPAFTAGLAKFQELTETTPL